MWFLVAENKTATTIMLIIGIICLLLACFVIFLYWKKLKKEKHEKTGFKMKEFQTKYQIFSFWIHVLYIFIIFTLVIGAVVLIAVGAG